jgi:hypothetical protein
MVTVASVGMLPSRPSCSSCWWVTVWRWRRRWPAVDHGVLLPDEAERANAIDVARASSGRGQPVASRLVRSAWLVRVFTKVSAEQAKKREAAAAPSDRHGG